MRKQVSIVLIGIGGYGNTYVKELLDEKYEAHIAGVVDINPENSGDYERIVKKNIPIFSSIEDFYATSQADLAIISSPIQFHKDQSIYAMLHGSNVLCEKPICASFKDAQEMIAVRDKTGKFLAIGFDWSFHPSVQQLKQDIETGIFGKPKRLKSIALWPRNKDYYQRSGWAGKKYSDNDAPIFDSVANNATSHFLHHMFYILGPTKEESCKLKNVTAELYRANPIETFDTCAVRINTQDDVEVLFYATHAVKENMGPSSVFEFEKATITYTSGKSGIEAHFNDGSKKTYPDPQKSRLVKLQTCIDAVAKENKDILCGPEAASAHVLCIQGMHESVKEANLFPEELVRYEKDTKLTYVDGLNSKLIECYDNWCLPSDVGTAWSKKGKTITL